MTLPVTLNLALLKDDFAREVLQRLQTLVKPLVLVGGSVRDLLLGRQLHDLDFVVADHGLDSARRIADAFGGAFLALDAQRDTGRALLDRPDGSTLIVDVAVWRGAGLADDLAARDFTINALAAVIEGDEARLVDVTGGVADLYARQLRATSRRAFAEDPVRCLRGVRLVAELSAWNFRLESETAGWLADHATSLARVSHERVRDELHRTLNASQPRLSLQRWADLGLLAVTLPEAVALQGVTQSPPHCYDVFEHTGYVLQHLAWLSDWIFGLAEPSDAFDAAAVAMLAAHRSQLAEHLSQSLTQTDDRRGMLPWLALCHDWGKPATRTVEQDGDGGPARIRFFDHDRVGRTLAAAAMRRLRFSEAQAVLVSTVVGGHMRPHLLAATGDLPSRRAVFRFYRDLGDTGVETLLLSLADLRATAGLTLEMADWQHQLDVVAALLQTYFHHAAEVVHPKPLLSGYEVMAATGLPPGPQIGKLNALLAEAQAVGDVQTSSEALVFIKQSMNLLQDPNT